MALKTPPHDDIHPSKWVEQKPTAVLVFADGCVLYGKGFGAEGIQNAELCFNTALTGYQEILTDPSYAGQIVTFTFPHIGNVGANDNDIETSYTQSNKGAVGCILKNDITTPSNWRASQSFSQWVKEAHIIGLCGVDTRALTILLREKGAQNCVIAHSREGVFDLEALKKQAKEWPGIKGVDLASHVTCSSQSSWKEKSWQLGQEKAFNDEENLHIVAIDYGVKSNILRLFADRGIKLSIVPAHASAQAILALKPDGLFLSNGPGDPAATGEAYAAKTIRTLIDHNLPIFGICLGHQLLAHSLGAQTLKMHQGHHGANHPVIEHATGKVEIVSMNHGFCVDRDSLPEGVIETHRSLFDETNCGIKLEGKPIFSIQHHPEASPGPHDSFYLFDRFIDMVRNSAAIA